MSNIIVCAIKLRNGSSGRQSNWTRNTQVISSRVQMQSLMHISVWVTQRPLEMLADAQRVVSCALIKGDIKGDGKMGRLSFLRLM